MPSTSDKDRSSGEHLNDNENEDIEDRLHTSTVYEDWRSRRTRGNRYHAMLSSFVVSLRDQVLDMPNQSRLLIIQHFTPPCNMIYVNLVSVSNTNLFKKKDGSIIPHSHQNLSCTGSGVDYSRFIGNNTDEELFTSLLRQLNFWYESDIR